MIKVETVEMKLSKLEEKDEEIARALEDKQVPIEIQYLEVT